MKLILLVIFFLVAHGCTLHPHSLVQLCLLSSCASEEADGSNIEQGESEESGLDVSPL